MSTYFGHNVKNRTRNFGTPRGGPPALRPPTPVAPRTGTGVGNKYNKYILPGPGPKAGGRYHVMGPGAPSGFRTPRSGVHLPPVVDSPFARNVLRAGQLARMLGRFGPVGRAIDLAGYAMDLWQVTQEGVPGGDFYPYDMSGFTRICRSQDPPYGHIKWSSNDPHLPCGTPSQVPNTWIGSGVAIPINMRWVSYGKTNPGATRMPLSEQWYREDGLTSPRPYVPPPGLQWPLPVPAVVQPMPGTATPPAPSSQERSQPRPRAVTRPLPRPYEEPLPSGIPGGGGPGSPGTHVRHPSPGEEKWVLKDPWIGKIYGKLTEMGDALDCLEDNMKGYRKPRDDNGLDQRMIRAAAFLYQHPNDVDWKGFAKCMVVNNVKDAVIGKANQLANRITKSPYWKRPVGVGRGGFSQRF